MPRVEFKNIYGIMSHHGVPKPAWRAFELLHTHAGNRRLPVRVSNQTRTTGRGAATDDAGGSAWWAVAVPCNHSDKTQLGWSYVGGALTWQNLTTSASASADSASPPNPPKNASGLCLDSANGNAALSLRPCVYLQPSQAFTRDGAAFKQLGNCLDVFMADEPDYRRIDLYSCNGGKNQQFDLDEFWSSALSSRSGACVAVRATHAGPPPPPPPPPLAPKAYVSAMATMNATGSPSEDTLGGQRGERGERGKGAASAAPAPLSSLRAFLSFWADPETPASERLADRRVTVRVRHAVGTAPATAMLYTIDDSSVHPAETWVAMGSPATPSASQLAALMEASQVSVVKAAPLVHENATCTALNVTLVQNSAVVVAFSAPSE